MEPTQDEVIEILKILDESNFDEIHFEKDGLKLIAIRGAKNPFIQEFKVQSKAPSQLQSPEKTMEVQGKEPAPKIPPVLPKANLPQNEPSKPEDSNLMRIKAPMLGTFYKGPKPGAPPFVDIGALVNEDTTVGLIEVMKCFTPVKAKISAGYIARMLAEDGQMVEYGQDLFLVRPAKN